jgi:imidazoleglycerol phosphate dehydratase HisB
LLGDPAVAGTVAEMPDHHTLLDLVKISEALRDALREAYELARAGESGEPLREALHFARDLLDLANVTLAGDPQAGEHARGMAIHMAEQLAAVEALLGPMAAG